MNNNNFAKNTSTANAFAGEMTRAGKRREQSAPLRREMAKFLLLES
jgi:hypothetical protein